MKKSKFACILALAILVLTAAPGCGSRKSSPTAVPTATDSAVTSFDTGSTESAPGSTVTADDSVGSSATMGQRNAAEKAKQYLEYTAFSYTGLIQQLQYEGYSVDEATYGADNCGADWNAQAAAKAQQYLEYTSFSRSGLIEQLEYEGFTSSQAEYGASAVGY